MRAWLWTIVICGGLSGCGDDDVVAPDSGPSDAGAHDASVDARTPTPLSVRAAGPAGAIVLDTDPLAFHVEKTDGTVVVMSAGSSGFELGTAGGGDARYHDPLVARPVGITYAPVDRGVERTSATTAVLEDAGGRRVRVTVEAPADRPGVYHLRFEKDAGVTDVALVRLALAASPGAYLGLGERFDGADARGKIIPMQFAFGGRASGTNERHVPVPLLVSSGGWGMFVQTREAGGFDVGATDPAEVRSTFEGGVLDAWFYVDPDPNQVVAKYAQQFGLPRLPPRWAFAPMHWRDEWADRAELEGDADAVRSEDNPCTTIWIDNPWQVSYNDLTFNETQFPDPPGLMAGLRRKGFVPLMWSTAYLDGVDDGATPANAAETLFVTARDNGWLVTQSAARGVYLSPAAPGANGAMVDFTSAAAMDMWVSRLRPLVAMGVRAFKLDYYEDIFPEVFGVRPDFHFSDGRTERELHGVFNTLFHTAYRRALDEGAGADGGFLFVRGSAWGGQTIADLIWPGDLDNDLREAGTTEVGGLPAAISAAQTLASSGFPTFSPDTGGYRGGMPTRESLLRWAELTTFLPIQQLGGDGAHHNPWLYDAEAGALWHRLTRIHMDLVPYLRMNALRASRTGYPPVSAPALAFPEDAGSVADPYAYMLGPDIFVAPTWQPGATTRAVHLPPGEWVHWFTGVRTTGPADLTVDAPLGQTPAFVRVGAIVPMLPEDLDTLVDADAPVVDPADRPYLRAWILPAGDRTIETEEGIGLRVARTATDVTLEVTPTAAGLDDLRMRIALDGASPAIATVTSVTDGSTAVTMAATADSVRAGCDGVCWFRDGTTLWLSARRRTASTIVVR